MKREPVQDQPARQLTVPEQKARAAHLASLFCPDCQEVGQLAELAPAHDVQPAWLGCKRCPWQGEEGRATHTAEDFSQKAVEKLMKRENLEPGGGGGGGGNSRKKPPKKVDRRPDQEPLVGGPDKTSTCPGCQGKGCADCGGTGKTATTKTTVVDTKSEVLVMRMSPGDKTLAVALANAHELTVTDLMLMGLRTVNALSPPAWWDFNAEAVRRGLAPEALLSHAVCSWWRGEVRETLG